jgi:hypothetical protein
MLKLIFTLVVSVSISRWIYAEVQLVAPAALPALDYVVERTEIPTHNTWSKDSFARVLAGVGKLVLLVQQTVAPTDTVAQSKERVQLAPTREKPSELERLLETSL